MKARYSSYFSPIMLLTIFFVAPGFAGDETTTTTTTTTTQDGAETTVKETTTTTESASDGAEPPPESASQNDNDNPNLIGPAGATGVIRRSDRRQDRRPHTQ